MNPYRRGELPLYLRYVLSTGRVMPAAQRFISQLRGKKKVPYKLRLSDVSSEPTFPDVDQRMFSGLKKLNAGADNIPSTYEVPLASRNIQLSEPQNWNLSFPDLEDTFAFHRFGWILPCLMENPAASVGIFFSRLVHDWINHVTPETHPLAWQTYNASERIVNWIYLWTLLENCGKSMASKPLVRDSLHQQAVYVLNHLEYFGGERDDSTNNHMLDDARAVYLTGCFLRIPMLQEAGRKIFSSELDRSFTPNGFLREGSSHYQLLLLARCLEVYETARSMDFSFAEEIRPVIARILFAARLFRERPENVLPLIGDVSPDFTPDWLKDIVFWNDEVPGGGWLGLRPSREKFPLNESSSKGFEDFLADGWCRFIGKDCRVFWHVQPEGRIPNYSHAHHDSGSFEFHLKNIPLLVDTGRANYTANGFGLYGRSARSHNACTIDGREPFVSDWLNGSRLVLDEYKKARVESSIDSAANCLAVSHDGFARLLGAGKFERKFHFRENEMVIEDRYEGKGKHQVDTYFQAAPDVKLKFENGLVSFHGDGLPSEVTLKMESASQPETPSFRGEVNEGGTPLGWYSPRYGKTVPATTIRFRQKTTLPLSNKFILRWS